MTSALNQVAADRADLSIENKTVSEQSSRKILFFEVVGPSFLVTVVGVLWVVLFLTMLFTRDHPYANRWAWFWLFTVGGGAAGPLLYLWKEPEPLRLRRWRPKARRLVPREPMTGGTGCLWAFVVGFLVVFAGAGITYLGTRALSW